MANQPLDFIPMWAMCFLTVLAMLATMEAGRLPVKPGLAAEIAG